ncbi:amidase [Xenorhabdus sp. XENO-10]|uniref:Amidase n=1 Tax=Xenorhabdus yunnanensis TaxID=3025878 RepID=A0ABT5LIH5_9GAMM|nr:amidase [Xenorhabdus yunnanensis]MDC9590293.1 amidase [Xenorhabdus yunnanensis]
MAITESLITTYTESDALGLAKLVHQGEVTPLELVEAAITCIERLNPELNAVVHKLYDIGREAAASVNHNAPFAGVPFLLKELASLWKGAPLTNSSRYQKDMIAPIDSEVTKRIKRAGLILVGKSNSPENGLSISTEPKLYGITKNPWKEGISAGGSSGGTAAAVAARIVPIGEASDGAGSIRIPASCCGIVGLKPSRGRMTLAPIGDYWYGGACFLCCSRTVRDTAAYLDAVAGALPGDLYTPPTPDLPWLELLAQEPRKLRVGFTVTPSNGTPIDAQVKKAVLATVRTLEGLGHIVEEHDMVFDTTVAWKAYTDMIFVQAVSGLNDLSSIVGRPVTPDDVEPITWAIIERGRSISGTTHSKDIEQIRLLGRELTNDLLPYDIFITPTLTQLPRPIGYYDMSETDIDRYNDKWTDSVFAFPFNITGQPAISLPLGWSDDGIPIGVQLVGRYGDEAIVLQVSAQLEQEMAWKDRRPLITT